MNWRLLFAIAELARGEWPQCARRAAVMRASDGPQVECVTLAEGPPGIESQRDVDGVVAPLLERAAALENAAGAFVIACMRCASRAPGRCSASPSAAY